MPRQARNPATWRNRRLRWNPGKNRRPTKDDRQAEARIPKPCAAVDSAPADELLDKIREQIERIDEPKTEATVAEKLKVSKKQARTWLDLFAEGKIRKLFKGSDVRKTEREISKEIQVSTPIRECLKRLVKENFLDKIPGRPVRYRSSEFNRPLFDPRN